MLEEKINEKIKSLKHRYFVYDIEVYPNVFTVAFEDASNPEKKVVYEISEYQNDIAKIKKVMMWLSANQVKLVGYNNFSFDYPVMHLLMTGLDQNSSIGLIIDSLYDKAMTAIKQNVFNFNDYIWYKDQIVKQVDLLKIHHFDNKAKMVSLKLLEFNMRSANISDLPYPVGSELSKEQIAVLKQYNQHDVSETAKFFRHSIDAIAFREGLAIELGKDLMCMSDKKIGTEYFIKRLDEYYGKGFCYDYEEGERIPRQTHRDGIALSDVIFPFIDFESNAFICLKKFLENQIIYETKGSFSDFEYLKLKEDSRVKNNHSLKRGGRVISIGKETNLTEHMGIPDLEPPKKGSRKKVKTEDEIKVKNLHCVYKGFRFDFGTGGIHGSTDNTAFVSPDKTRRIADVASYYPSINIMAGLYPEHLGAEFSSIYQSLKELRFSYPKSNPINAVLKLALNAAGFGDTNNVFSPFYDPKMTMSITVNGQLMLCMLAEKLLSCIPNLRIIQINTDGVDVEYEPEYEQLYRDICNEWQSQTGMVLEYFDAYKVFQRDVNNYISVLQREYDNNFQSIKEFDYGEKVKLKGDYTIDLGWEKNHSQLIVPKAVKAVLVDGADLEQFIRNHDDIYDFMLRAKVPRSSRLVGIKSSDEGGLPDWFNKLSEVEKYSIFNFYHELAVELDDNGDLSDELADSYGLSKKMRKYLKLISNDKDFVFDGFETVRLQNITRYYVSTDGAYLCKIMPPLVEGGFDRYLSINAGLKVTECNNIEDARWENINYQYYIDEVMKLINPVKPPRKRLRVS